MLPSLKLLEKISHYAQKKEDELLFILACLSSRVEG
ncbi:MAG: hypothetical protein MRERC_7c077 [Mycoplasmataceae bacterium RC_NB112A]|nr:MAG: hypothetical protein MRERC_8c076 [Mycoplasmataceae bacterium RC_NB112A]KLL01911.1 MAG: hypothetical protein MRERC_7c077 [Mycoplasmataceae bacterium RC_NB112A]